jgi:hypothetical protein
VPADEMVDGAVQLLVGRNLDCGLTLEKQAMAKATAGSSTPLRCAQNDAFFIVGRKSKDKSRSFAALRMTHSL